MRFALYILVGAVAWLVDVGVYYLFWPVVGIAFAQFLARVAGAVAAFLLNRNLTFQANRNDSAFINQAARYVALLAVNWVVTVGLIYLLNFGLGMHPVTAKILVDVFVVPGNYLIMKYLVFPGSPRRLNRE